MADAHVSREALDKVRCAMSEYACDTSGIIHSLCHNAMACDQQCAIAIKSVKTAADKLSASVCELRRRIDLINQEISSLHAKIKKGKDEILQCEDEIHRAEFRLAQLQKELIRLKGQLSQSQDEKAQEQIELQICQAERALVASEQKLSDARDKMMRLQQQQKVLKERLDKEEGALLHAKNELRETELEYARILDKLERMRSAYIAVQSNTQALIDASHRISSDDSVRRGLSKIDECISYLDEYMSIAY